MGGKGKRRQTAKTGDRGIYKKRLAQHSTQNNNDADDNAMYDAVDRFHNQQLQQEEDFVKLDGNDDDSEDDNTVDQQEAVMDLALGGSDDDDESSQDDNDVEDRAVAAAPTSDDDDSDPEGALSSDDDDDMQDNDRKQTNVRDWGRQKKDYYHGDTADLEIGQDTDDALVEEEAAKEMLQARYQEMKEEDFILSDDDDDEQKGKGFDQQGDNETLPTKRDCWKKVSRSEKTKLLDRQHPELLPLVSHFSDVFQKFKQQTNVVTEALLEGEEGTAQAVGATKLGQQYLVTKAMLQSCAGLNLAVYLLLKSEQPSELDSEWIQSHPVMKDLHKMNSLLYKLENQVEKKVPGLDDQMDKLVKASALLANGQMDVDEETDEESDFEEQELDKTESKTTVESEKHLVNDRDGGTVSSSDDSIYESDKDDDSVVREQARARSVANEARFALRAAEVSIETEETPRKRRAAPALDFGDTTGNDEIGKSLAATLNSIEQRSATRQRKVAPMAGTIDKIDDDDIAIRRGLAMMEEDLGPDLDEGNDNMDDDGDTGVKDAYDPESDDDEDDDFYAYMTKNSRSKKAFKKNLYSVKPKYPRMEEEIEGERAISRAIMKNRGLVAHKNKLNRNPRVKKREQYRKAIIRRKGAVREVRKDEGHKYGGEATGIKTNIARSRKLA